MAAGRDIRSSRCDLGLRASVGEGPVGSGRANKGPGRDSPGRAGTAGMEGSGRSPAASACAASTTAPQADSRRRGRTRASGLVARRRPSMWGIQRGCRRNTLPASTNSMPPRRPGSRRPAQTRARSTNSPRHRSTTARARGSPEAAAANTSGARAAISRLVADCIQATQASGSATPVAARRRRAKVPILPVCSRWEMASRRPACPMA